MLNGVLQLEHLAVEVVIAEPEVPDLVLEVGDLRHQLHLADLVVGLHPVKALTLQPNSALQRVLLPLLLEEAVVRLEQQVTVPVVLHLNLHDVPVLVKDVLPRDVKARVLLNARGLLSIQELVPRAHVEVRSTGQQAVRSTVQVAEGVAHHTVECRARDGQDTGGDGGLHMKLLDHLDL